MRGAVIGSLFQSHYQFDGYKQDRFNALIDVNPVVKDAAVILCFNKTLTDMYDNTVSDKEEFSSLFRKNLSEFAEGTYSDIFKTWAEADKRQPLKIYDDRFVLPAASIGVLCKNHKDIKKEVKKIIGCISSDSDVIKTAELLAGTVYAACHGALKSEIADLCLRLPYILKFDNKIDEDEEDEVYDDETYDIAGEEKNIQIISVESADASDFGFFFSCTCFFKIKFV